MDTKEQFICSICEKHFSTKFSLSRHSKSIHEKLRPFVCKCSKSFATLDQLRRHNLYKHNKSKQLKCAFNCPKTFSTKKALMSHEKRSHRAGIRKCPLKSCNTEYSTRSEVQEDHKEYDRELNGIRGDVLPKKHTVKTPEHDLRNFKLIYEGCYSECNSNATEGEESEKNWVEFLA